jgi:hypothetical protein
VHGIGRDDLVTAVSMSITGSRSPRIRALPFPPWPATDTGFRGLHMRKAWVFVLVMVVAVAGCASMADAGWQGRDAQPFDASKAQCEAEGVAAGDAGKTAFEACMEARGWTRPTER